MGSINKKVLVLYASAGHGHEKAARAIAEAVRDQYPGYEVSAKDVIAFMPGIFSHVYRQTYLLQIKLAPWLWGIFYYFFDVPWIYAFVKLLRRLMNAANSSKLTNLLMEEKPDVIITTHFFATEVSSYLRGRGKIKSKIITVVTDYLPHYVWTAKNSDMYAVALPETKVGLTDRGVRGNRIEVVGIPVEKKFLAPVDSAQVRKNLGLEEGLFTVLLTSGGVGIASIADIVKDLSVSKTPMQLLVVCGTNQSLKLQLEKTYQANPAIKLLGFVTNMNELMEISDIVVGKAGGLTITESFLKGKPVVLYRSIPGQEARNVDIVLRYGAGYATDNDKEVARIVERLAKSQEEMRALKKAAGQIARPQAAKAIADLAARL